MDLVKLAIVYETQAASASITRLNAQLAATQKQQQAVTTSARVSNQELANAVRWYDQVRGGASKASNAIQRIGRDVALAQAHFAAGRINAADYATALATARQQATALAANLKPNQIATFNRIMQQTAISTGVSNRAMRGAAQGAVVLARGLATGRLSAVSFASGMGRVASVIFGPWGIAIALAAGALSLLMNRQQKAREESQRLGDQLRDVRRRVDDLMGGRTESPFASEIQRLTDLIIELDRQVEKMQNSWLRRAQDFLSTVGLNIPGFGTFRPSAPGPIKEGEQAKRLRGERGRLLQPGAEALAELARYNKEIEVQSRLLGALNEGPFAAVQENIRLLREHMGNLAQIEGPEAAEALARTAVSLHDATEALRRMERQSRIVENGLQTMADALEDFVITGTLAFTDFLNSILRMLYRDFTGELVSGITRSVTGGSGAASVSGGDPVPVPGPINGPSPSVMTNVNFTVQTIDTQGVSTFLERHGARIAGIVAGQADRSLAIRRKLLGR